MSLACSICRQPILAGEPSEIVYDEHLGHANPEHCVAATARRCAVEPWELLPGFGEVR